MAMKFSIYLNRRVLTMRPPFKSGLIICGGLNIEYRIIRMKHLGLAKADLKSGVVFFSS